MGSVGAGSIFSPAWGLVHCRPSFIGVFLLTLEALFPLST